jgi:hypothetical protein
MPDKQPGWYVEYGRHIDRPRSVRISMENLPRAVDTDPLKHFANAKMNEMPTIEFAMMSPNGNRDGTIVLSMDDILCIYSVD